MSTAITYLKGLHKLIRIILMETHLGAEVYIDMGLNAHCGWTIPGQCASYEITGNFFVRQVSSTVSSTSRILQLQFRIICHIFY